MVKFKFLIAILNKIIILNFLPEEFAEKSIYVHIILEFVYFP